MQRTLPVARPAVLCKNGAKTFQKGLIMTTFAKSLSAFKKASPWLGDEHSPEVTALEFLAARLDGDKLSNPAPLIAQWGLIMRSLRKSAPVDPDADDPVEQALREAGQ